jgi:glycolate oxidase FAD binding subunit
MSDLSTQIASRVRSAYQARTALNICGAGTKSFLGNPGLNDETLDIRPHTGIIEYDPAELVMVARSGTSLNEIVAVLSDHRQMLGFEPPFVDDGATLGGAVASGLAGPRRAYTGAVRDFVLGANFINGTGEIITSGGKVFKNVAGFDLFRPMARSMGTLGVLLKVALRVVPRPELEETLLHEENDERVALEKMNNWVTKMQTMSAATWDGHNIRIRLSGSAASIEHGQSVIGGQFLENECYWQELNNFKLDFFQQPGRLWRISLAPMSACVNSGHAQLIDWGGAQRWLKSDEPADVIRSRATALGGHAECYSADQEVVTFQPLNSGLLALHQRFKASFDPAGIFNPARMYAEL